MLRLVTPGVLQVGQETRPRDPAPAPATTSVKHLLQNTWPHLVRTGVIRTYNGN